MPLQETVERLTNIPDLKVVRNEPLGRHTRFGIGGPADVFASTGSEEALAAGIRAVQSAGARWMILGAGTNLVVADTGFRGVILHYTGSAISSDGLLVRVESGAVLQDLVDYTLARGLAGIHTMTGIPGLTGAAIYGNAGAYGRSIHQCVSKVVFFDGQAKREFNNAECQFAYRESIFKRQKAWTILAVELTMSEGDAVELTRQAGEIRAIRDAKYPPTMKCAGSIFKNLLFKDLPPAAQAEVPPNVVREGKVPSAWFLEQTGVKGMKDGGIQIADYHANLIYNAGGGTAQELVRVICECKARVRRRFGFDVEEEVQYVGFETPPAAGCCAPR